MEHHDTLPRVPVGLYLKLVFELHTVNFTLAEKQVAQTCFLGLRFFTSYEDCRHLAKVRGLMIK